MKAHHIIFGLIVLALVVLLAGLPAGEAMAVMSKITAALK